MLRRIHRRMLVAGANSFASYVRLLDEDATEAPSLMRELLISVTSFFRDAEAFAALAPVIRRLIEGKRPARVRAGVVSSPSSWRAARQQPKNSNRRCLRSVHRGAFS